MQLIGKFLATLKKFGFVAIWQCWFRAAAMLMAVAAAVVFHCVNEAWQEEQNETATTANLQNFAVKKLQNCQPARSTKLLILLPIGFITFPGANGCV